MPPRRPSSFLKQSFSLRSSVFASFAGNGFAFLIYIVSVPFYLPYIGIEAYGLLGFFISFQALLSVLDLGLTVTLTRELAIRGGDKDRSGEVRDLVRTTEVIQWGAALLIGVVSVAVSPIIARSLDSQNLSPDTLRQCFIIMSVALALQFPISLYSGGLFGLEKQVLFSIVNVFFALFRNVGVIAVLHFISATPQGFFAWQAFSAGLHVLTLGGCLWLSLPAARDRARFRLGSLKQIWRFSTGLGLISIASVLITQIDKFVLIRILPLEIFGYYAIAGIAAGGLHRLIQPIFQAFMPRLSQLVGSGDEAALARTYHLGCQLIAVVVLPLSAVCVFFPREVLWLWQRDQAVADNTYLLLALLTAGGALNSLLFVPYALQLAYGWTKLNLYALTAAVFLSVPMIVLLANKYGAVGAAAVWIIFNTSFILILIPIMHRRLLPDEKWAWYLDDVIKPIAAVVIAAALCRYFFVETGSRILLAAELAAVFVAVSAAAAASAWYIRNRMLDWAR